MADTLASLIAELEEKKQAAEDRERAQSALAFQKYGPTREQGISALLTALAPVAIGAALGGKRGAGIGAGAGASGVAGILQSIEKEGERRNARAALEAKSALREAQGYDKEIMSLRGYAAKEPLRQARKGSTNVTVNFPPQDQPMSDGMQKQMDAAGLVAASAQTTLDNISRLVPDLDAKTYYNEDGTINPTKVAGVWKDYLAAKVVGSESDIGKVNQEIKMFTTDFLRAISGAAMTDPEYKRLSEIVNGEGIVPATIPTVMENIARLQARYKNSFYEQFDRSRLLRTPGRTADDVYKHFQKYAPGMPNVSGSMSKAVPVGRGKYRIDGKEVSGVRFNDGTIRDAQGNILAQGHN